MWRRRFGLFEYGRGSNCPDLASPSTSNMLPRGRQKSYGLPCRLALAQNQAVTHIPGVFIFVMLSAASAKTTDRIPISMKCRESPETERSRVALAGPTTG